MMNFDNLFRGFILTQSFVPPQVAIAHFQLVLPRDHRFGVDTISIGICFTGTDDHGFSRRRLLTTVPLINQYRIGSILLANPYYGLRKPPDQSRSSLFWPDPLSLLSCASWSSSSTVFCDGVLSKACQIFYDYLRE
ncbi:unnamed protein product [Rotaria sordida]|uniref:Uncharacterized protein n=1 Tax=Rotaria sordida TaxID=392033 RepID=A0A816BIP3_9BILA|nr:unnamed protein product [Rotaria sordida]CAF1610933.1 unnamed protein product [Rotaria sordida]